MIVIGVAVTCTGLVKLNVPAPVPVKFAPRFILAPLVKKVTGLEKLSEAATVIAPALIDPMVIALNPGCK